MGRVAAAIPPTDFRLEALHTFPDGAVPVRCRAERLELHRYAAGGCRVEHA